MNEKIVAVDEELASRIEIIRHRADHKIGFQRELDHDRVRGITRAVKEGTFIPPIFVGELPDKRMVLIDGQHRLQAYRFQKFPLTAIIYKEDSVKTAAAQFIATNANGVRVSLGFRLKVDPGPDAKWMRELADRYETSPNTIYSLVVGITGKHKFNSEGRRANKHSRELTERIMETWTRDKRWNDRAHLYSSVAALKVVGTIAGESTNPTSTIKYLMGLDWTKRSRLGAITGSSWVFQDKMYKFILRGMKRTGHLTNIRLQDEKKVNSGGGVTRRHS